MRYAAILIVLFAGCGSPDVPPPGTYAPLVSASLGVAATSDAPAPSPTPAPAGKCENCNGTGRLGDGTVSVPCPVCGGDGRTDNEPAPVKSQPTPACQCADCTCDPCECQPVKDTRHDPKAVPVPDFYPPLRDARDVLNDQPGAASTPVQSKSTPKPTASPSQSTAPAAQEYYQEPRRLFRGGGIFRRGGSTSDGQSVATSC